MAIGIVSLIADGRVRLKVYCGNAACLSRAVNKSYLSVKQSSFQWLKLKNSSSGSYKTASLRNTDKREDADKSAHISCMIMVCTICGKLIIPKTCSSEMRPKYICAASSGHIHVCAYTWIALNLMRSRKTSAEKEICENRMKLTTCADRPPDNHVVYIRASKIW